MTDDALFQDGARHGPDTPLRLMAQGPDDLPSLSAVLQDAVFTGADLAYLPARRRMALMVARFRWEDMADAQAKGRRFERVKSLIVIDNILALRRAGFDPKDRAQVHALLALAYAPRDALGGTLSLIMSGTAGQAAGQAAPTIAIDVEAIDITLRDVARPHYAQAKSAPDHGA